MSERKVLNKYYPPDFDPSKIPRLRLPKDRQYTVRLMAPCNMRCTTCGEYIYKGKKFNARKETVQNEEYLGIKVFRFYIKCPRCLAEITFKTDPQNADYVVEHGATRNFQALKLAEEQAEREAKEIEDEEKNNPMMLLENRTKASKQEMDLLEALEDLKDLNQRHASVDFEGMIDKFVVKKNEDDKKTQEDEDEDFIKSVFGKSEGPVIKRLADEDSDEEIEPVKKIKTEEKEKPTEILTSDKKPEAISKPKSWEKSVGVLGKKSLSSLVRVKPASKPEVKVHKPTAMSSIVSSANSTTQKSNALNLLGAYSGSESE